MFSRFIRNQTQFFLHIPLAIYRNFRNWYQVVTDLVRTKFMLYRFSYQFLVYRFHRSIDYFKKTHSTKLQSLSKTDVISTLIRVREG